MIYTITDKTGASYAVAADHLDRSTRFRVQNSSPWIPPIGHCNLWDSGDGVFEIMEIAVAETLEFRNPSFVKRWFIPRVSVDYRGKGLGSALLECVISHAKRTGCLRLVVHRVHGFENNRVDLATWYQRHGFSAGSDGRLQMEFA
jgi:GNAT superfamily N-acetyltransferase